MSIITLGVVHLSCAFEGYRDEWLVADKDSQQNRVPMNRIPTLDGTTGGERSRIQPRSNTVRQIPPHSHRRQMSKEEENGIRKGLHDPNKDTLDIFNTSPERKPARRPILRRNSDTSVMDVKDKERRRERRREERREANGGKPRTKRTNRRVDVIDKLDVTGISGFGMFLLPDGDPCAYLQTLGFHHDGPFDACLADRNRKGRRPAPMQAFAEGSLNNALGGSGPVNRKLDFDTFHGRSIEGYSDYNTSQMRAPDSMTQPQAQIDPRLQQQMQPRPQPSVTRRPVPPPRTDSQKGVPREITREFQPELPAQPQPSGQRGGSTEIFDPKGRDYDDYYGQETAGLGASTFLEGTPAPKSALQRRDSENDSSNANGGLQRKKSLANRFRGRSNENKNETKLERPSHSRSGKKGDSQEANGELKSALKPPKSETKAPAPDSSLAVPSNAPTGSLQRKKSLADRLRRTNTKTGPKPPRPVDSHYGAEDYTTSDARYMMDGGQWGAAYSQVFFDYDPPSPKHTQSAGGRNKMNDKTPFFDEPLPEEPAEEAEPEREIRPMVRSTNNDPDQLTYGSAQRARTASSPPRGGLMRRMTGEKPTNGAPPEKENKSGGGLLTRMKSLKGGGRPRPSGSEAA